MALKRFFVVLGVLLLLAAGWRLWRSESVQLWLNPTPEQRLQIRFDNGTVRQAASAASVVPGSARVAGGLRKCQRGAQVVYTDGLCAPGATEQAVTRGTVNVMPGHGPAPAAAAAAAGPTTPPRGNLHDVADRSAEMTISERRLQQAVTN